MDVMPRLPLRARALAALSIAVLPALAGCGSSTTTVTAASAPSQPASTATTPAPTTSAATSPAPPASTTSPAGGTTAPSTIRTEAAPEFTQHETQAEGSAGAQAKVRSLGYTPGNAAEYHPSQTLKVLVGTRSGSGDGYGQLAFFFVGSRYIGTDVKVPSAKIAVVSQSESEVTIAYPLYRHGDPLCCPGAGQAKVTFQLNNGHLQPLSAIPAAHSATGVSRN